MPDLNDLLAQRAALDAEIRAHKPHAVASVIALMETLGVTWADLGVAAPTARPKVTRRVKYRDDRGNTWTGVGQRPVWLRERLLHGATLEQFQVKE